MSIQRKIEKRYWADKSKQKNMRKKHAEKHAEKHGNIGVKYAAMEKS